MRRILPLLLAALAFAPASGEDPCGSCKGSGEAPCAKHKALNVADLKVGEFLCADCLDLDCCHGIGWGPCPRCKDPRTSARWKGEFDRRKRECERVLSLVEGTWMEATKLRFVKDRRDLEARKKTPKAEPAVPRVFLNVLSGPLDRPQVYLLTDLPPRRVVLPGQTALTPLDAHQCHHLYLSRMLEVFHEMEDLHREGAFGDKRPPRTPLSPKAMEGINYSMLLFANEEAQRKVTAKVFQHETPGPFQGAGMAMAADRPGQFAQDKDLHQWVFAAIAGGMLGQYNDDPARTPEQRKDDIGLPEWLAVGFTHVLEIRRWGVCDEAPTVEAKKSDPKKGVEPWVAANWPKAVLALVGKDKARPFPELSSMVMDDMRCSDHQLAWSYADFLLRKGMDKLARLVPMLRKKGVKQAEAIREVYGLTQAELEGEWKSFVQKTYSK